MRRPTLPLSTGCSAYGASAAIALACSSAALAPGLASSRSMRKAARVRLVGRPQAKAVAQALLQRSKERRPHQLEADAADGALASDLGDPGIERALPVPAGVDVRDPRHQLHRRHVARAHRDEKPRL